MSCVVCRLTREQPFEKNNLQKYCFVTRQSRISDNKLGGQAILKEETLKGLFHPAYIARVVSWFALVVAICMAQENGDKQRPTKR